MERPADMTDAERIAAERKEAEEDLAAAMQEDLRLGPYWP